MTIDWSVNFLIVFQNFKSNYQNEYIYNIHLSNNLRVTHNEDTCSKLQKDQMNPWVKPNIFSIVQTRKIFDKEGANFLVGFRRLCGSHAHFLAKVIPVISHAESISIMAFCRSMHIAYVPWNFWCFKGLDKSKIGHD